MLRLPSASHGGVFKEAIGAMAASPRRMLGRRSERSVVSSGPRTLAGW